MSCPPITSLITNFNQQETHFDKPDVTITTAGGFKTSYIQVQNYKVMEKKLVKKRIMRSKAIQQVNDATIVLRHFIELSAKLLPFFNELSKKERLLPKEMDDRQRIIDVFHGYKFDTSTSLILMNSSILDNIQNAFDQIEKRVPGEPSKADDAIERFFDEHESLVHNWIQTDSN